MRKIKLTHPFKFPLTEKTLKDIIVEGAELRSINGHVHFSKLGKTIVGRVSDFDVNRKELDPSQNYLVVFIGGEPNSDSKFTVKKVNAYSIKVEVYDPD
ncbi:MAG: hypothetical protein AAB681_02125 [Patescibacteria group bacterium]